MYLMANTHSVTITGWIRLTMNLTETHNSQILSVACETQDRQTQSWLGIPASWASGASSEAGGPACLSASVGPNPKTGEAPDARKGGEGSSPGMETGEGPASSLAFFFPCRHRKPYYVRLFGFGNVSHILKVMHALKLFHTMMVCITS